MLEDSPFIFISYSRKDKGYVDKLVRALRERGLPVWLDDHIEYGTTWPRVIQEHLEKCQVFLLVMSPRSSNSHWVACELKRALELEKLKKSIFPLLLEGEVWFEVGIIQSTDVRGGKLPDDSFFDKVRGYFPGVGEIRTNRIPVGKSILGRIQDLIGILLDDVDDLSSEKGVDYTKLRGLLKAGKWEKADHETYRVMLKVVGRKEGDWIRAEELLNIPCTDLRTIDQLWVNYSNGRFGFSVQKKIYLECGGKPDGKYYEEAWKKFGDRVGWRVNSSWIDYVDVIFNTSSPTGHLPSGVGVWFYFWGEVLGSWGRGEVGCFSSLASRLVNCSAIRSVEVSRNTQG